MEIIGTGILLAIGFYVAPIVLGGAFIVIAGVLGGIASIFKR